MDATRPRSQGSDDASPIGGGPVLAAIGPIGRAQGGPVASNGTSRPCVGGGPSGRTEGASEVALAVLVVARKDVPVGHAVVATGTGEVLLPYQASTSPAGVATVAWPYRRPTRTMGRVGARGRRARASLAVRRRPRRVAARNELHLTIWRAGHYRTAYWSLEVRASKNGEMAAVYRQRLFLLKLRVKGRRSRVAP